LKFYFTIILFLSINLVFAQDFILNERYIQLTGLVLNADSQKPVPNASIRIRFTYRGVSANTQGFFSLVVKEGDWIDITSMGFKKQSVQVPTGLKEPSYVKIFALESDTILFKPVNIYPWPSRAKFKEAFMTVQINKSYQEIMNENFNRITMQLMMGILLPDAYESQTSSLQDYSKQAATKGITPTLGVGANIPFGSTKGYTPKKSDKPAIKW
jgi:hypothetical protein